MKNTTTTILSAFVTISLGACAVDQADDAADDDYTDEGRLAANGLTPDNLYAVGVLPAATITTTQLETWNAAGNGVVIPYLLGCALASNQSMTFDNNGTPVTVNGGLGLASTWTTSALTTQQQEMVSGCLLARMNEAGVSVTISMRGEAAGYSLQSGENLAYSVQEGAYFGNLFIPSYRHFSCRGSGYANAPATRVCELSGHCGVTWAGACGSVCTGSDGYYASCTINGLPVTTYSNVTTVYDHI